MQKYPFLGLAPELRAWLGTFAFAQVTQHILGQASNF